MTETIAIIGGTGPEGRGLATRLVLAGHTVIIGSRDPERGASRRRPSSRAPSPRATDPALSAAAGNAEACQEATLAIVDRPLRRSRPDARGAARAPLRQARHRRRRAGPLRARPPAPVEVADGSATEEAAALLPDSTVVGAFHNLDAETLLEPDVRVDADVLLTGGAEGKRRAGALAEQIAGVRAVDAGPLRYSRFVEGITILLSASTAGTRAPHGYPDRGTAGGGVGARGAAVGDAPAPGRTAWPAGVR